MIVAGIRRVVFKPARYAVPAKYGKAHTADAIFLLALIAILMVADSLFEATQGGRSVLRQARAVEFVAVLSLPWMLKGALASASLSTLRHLHFAASYLHELTFYFLLCYRPFGIQFHVETSLFNIYFAKLDRGTVKPVQWGVADEHLDQVKSFGVKNVRRLHLEAHARFLFLRRLRPVLGQVPGQCGGKAAVAKIPHHQGEGLLFPALSGFRQVRTTVTPLIGGIYSEDEIWSCTTCGACEEECPLLVEYIDKIVDLRRGMIDDGNVPSPCKSR